VEHPFAYPVFVKPARIGSSVGISKAHDEEELVAAVELARRHDDKVLIEELLDGVEVECGVLGSNREPIASEVGEIVPTEWYDYSGSTTRAASCWCRPGSHRRSEKACWLSSPSSRRTAVARVDSSSTRAAGRRQLAQHDPGFTATSVYAKLFGERDPVRGAARPARGLALERHERRRTLAY
jgi:D-alanine-D-alanine ligase